MSIRRRIKIETRDRKDVLNEAIITQDEFLERFFERPKKFQFFFGAGMSASAGVPLSQEIIDEIIVKVFEKSNPAKRGQVNAEDLKEWVSREKWFNPNFAYISALEKEYPSQYLRTELFKRYMKGKFPSPSQLNYAIGVKEEKLNNRCYTTNWDTLTEDAFYWLRGTNCVTIKGVDQLREVKDFNHRYVIKFHGDIDRYDVRYLREGMAKHNDDLKEFLISSLSNVGLVVMGYSGSEYSVMNMLMEIVHENAEVLNGGLYWAYKGNTKHIPEAITDLIAVGLDKGKEFRLFETEDADFVFEHIGRELNLTSIEDELSVAFFRFNKMTYGTLRERMDMITPSLQDLVHRDILDEGFLVRDYNLIHEVWRGEKKGLFKKREEIERAAKEAERKLINHSFNDLKHENFADAEVKLKDVQSHFPENEMVYWGLGWSMYATGRYKDALNQFDKALEFNQKNFATFVAKAMCFHNLGRFAEELSMYDKVLEIKGNLDFIWYNRALAASRLGDRNTERTSYESAISIHPGNYLAWYNLGICHHEEGKPLEALRCFKKSNDINSKMFNAHYNTGVVLGKLGQDGQAVSHFDKCIAINEEDDLSFKSRGIAELMTSHFQQAVESFEEYLHAEPEDTEVWANYGLSLYGTERLTEAMEYTEKYLAAKPQDSRVWYNKGLIFERMGDKASAMECYDKSLALNDDFDMVWYRKALLMGEMQQFDGEIEFLTRFLNRNEQDQRGWFELGEANRRLGDNAEGDSMRRYYSAAVNAYDRALDIQRTDTSTWLKKTVCLNRLQRYDDALECIQYLLRYDKDNAEVWFQRGISYDGKGDHLAAADSLSQTLKLNPDHEGAYYLRGMLLAELEQFAKAVDHFDQVIRTNPEKWQAYHYKGVCTYQQKEYERAMAVFEDAERQFPAVPRFLVDQALVHVMKRQTDEARQKLQRAIGMNPQLRDEIQSTPEFNGLL